MSQPTGRDAGAVVVIGGTAGLGRDLAQHYVERGHRVVITGRDPERAARVAAGLGQDVTGIGVDLTDPARIADALRELGPVSRLALCAFFRDRNTVRGFQLDSAQAALTIKLLGYYEVVHALAERIDPAGAILLYGGGLKDRPLVGTVTVAAANAAVMGMVRAMAVELQPIRVNAIHPGMVADTPFWSVQPAEVREGVRAKTPTGRFTVMREVTEAAVLLLENPAINAANLDINGGAIFG